ncbi:MAG: penicillin-binding transpeptidase domain-containing protein [Sporolactobacillus sp.]|jgi:penicillin-binding protein|nr:penicillin-binding transpeptidase domain-containing protein [Sporolactobacillus sp.]
MRHRHDFIPVIIIAVLLLALVGCGTREPTAKERLDTYTKAWAKHDFAKMYDYLSAKSKKTISKADFVARYQKVYDGIDAGKLAAKVGTPAKKHPASVPLKAKLATVAGTVNFTVPVHMRQEKRDNKENWYVDWKPALILPGLSSNDTVRVGTLPAKRGAILDKNGKPLATNGTAARIDLVPGKLGTGDKRDQTIKRLAKLTGVAAAQIESALKAGWVKADSLVPITTVNAGDKALLKKATSLPGVYKTDVEARIYPDREASGHLTGYVGKITAELLKNHPHEGYNENSLIGRTGLEQLYEKKLRAKDGAVIRILDASGNEKKILAQKKAQNGQDVQLTIDRSVQDALYDQLKKDSGAAVAIQPKSGDILGLVSAPSYDPNVFALGISSDAYQKLSKDSGQPLRNRFSEAGTPGSTFKPLTAALALEHHAIQASEQVAIKGKRWQPNASWGDYYVTRLDSDPNVNLEEALFRSDNIYFARAALKIGADAFISGSKKYGFGESIPLSYPMQKSTIANDGKLDSDTLLANTGYGQGQVRVSPLHLSLIYSALVNDGNMIKPRLIKTEKPAAYWKKAVMSSQTAQLLNKDLEQVVDNSAGTAHDAKINGVPLAGKTGTPEFKKKQGESGKENGWFVAYNTDDPKLLVTMMVENTQKKGGSHYVTPKVRAVFEKLLKP